jgi:hypothetical protein
MTPRASIIDPMRRHHLVLEALPELLHALFHILTLETVEILDYRIVIRGPFEFKTWL